jgi:D-alanyl-lipoteichoic acid acyltransferase DltB (MBOAT superfamily)
MLFNSYGFICVFLPVTLAGFFAIARGSRTAAAVWLGLASLVFYSWWDIRFTALLIGSVALNFLGGRLLSARAAPGDAIGVAWLLRGFVAADLLILGFFKYMNFFVTAAGDVLHSTFSLPAVVLPIGISFFTFTQIAFLVDTARGRADRASPVHYLLFVTYFPHLIAGPVLHHAEMIPQFRRAETYSPRARAIAVGLTVFMLGLFKKVVLADEVGAIADAAFSPAHVHTLGFLAAWDGALAYTLQIYFDFSAYTDMAIGLSRMFNIGLPANFESPYKACSIIDFWRRWHMTLSRFLRDYLYIPLGGNRHGRARRYANLLATMVLGGLWHGAGWTFLAWGALHGLFLVFNHGWRAVRGVLGIADNVAGLVGRLAGWALTFSSVVVAWVFFRAPDLNTAIDVLSGMTGSHAGVLSAAMAPREVVVLATSLAIALVCPNIREIMAHEELVLDAVRRRTDGPFPTLRIGWRPSAAWATACFGLFVISMLQMTRVSQFLYFRF